MAYLRATRHPWPCLLFLVPLLIAYEVGVLYLGGPHPETVRNGADHWLRCALEVIGLRFFWVPPLVLVVAFAVWAYWRREDSPPDMGGVLCGMVLESITFALGLWVVCRLLAPLFVHAGLSVGEDSSLTTAEPAMRQLITYLGAGIYEEALFRLLLFSALVGLLRLVDLPLVIAVPTAALASGILFSMAHHIGPYGQAYSNYLFLFRLAAGLYFALLYQLRGFGIVVGAHACYNVMVSIS
jgi:hypothetical protein